jgi:hypothetical protein
MNYNSKFEVSSPAHLSWFHYGTAFRATPWPSLQIECETSRGWISISPTVDLYASAAATISTEEWNEYMDFVPYRIRNLVDLFKYGKLEALYVVNQCYKLIDDLEKTPALISFLAAHELLRGFTDPEWSEINAMYERAGIFGILEWLGLPASKQTLTILSHLISPDIPRRVLTPLRSHLWEPKVIFDLKDRNTISHSQIIEFNDQFAA